MKRPLWMAAALAAVALIFWIGSRLPAPDSRAAATDAGTPAEPGAALPGAGSREPVAAVFREAVVQSGAPGSTPPVDQPATPADGFVEARVLLDGKPLPGAHVRLYLHGRVDRSTAHVDWRLAGAADSGRDGIARIAARPGSYLAAARSGTYAPAHVEFPRPAGERTTRVVLELSAGVAITGRTVQKPGGEAVPLALVTLTHGARRPDAPAEEQARATSDTEGKFRIAGLQPGRYVATAQASGYAKATARIDTTAAREITLELAASSFIEGRVVQADGSPAAGAEVFATGGEDAAYATASETGAFSLEVAPRSWDVGARKGDATGRAEHPVTVAAGATARGVRIQLGAQAGIAGTVVAASSQQPIAGAQIAVSPYGANGDSGRAVSDARGAFAVTGLAPGSYDVAVSAAGYSDGLHRGVTVEQGQQFPLRVELHQNGAVSGTVRDAAGHGVPFALIRAQQGRLGFLAQQQPPAEARADENGAYTLAGLPAGRASLSAMRDGSAFGATALADVPEGGVAHVDFDLKDEGVVSGHVRRADGSLPPPDTAVAIVPAGPGMRMGGFNTVPIDESGAYVASLAVGAYSLSATGPRGPGGFGFGRSKFVTIEAGKTATQDLVYAALPDDPQGFGGRVVEADGSPSAGATVSAPRAFSATADEGGAFHSGRARTDLPDTFDVTAMNGGRSGKATVAPNQPDVTVQLQPAATLRGHLSGGPVDSFRVDLRLQQAMPWFGAESLEFTGDRFELRDVPGLPVHLTVTTQDGRSAQLDVALSPGASQDVEVPLQPLAQIAGRLIDSGTQQPVASASVGIEGRGMFGGGGVTGADGRFALTAPAGDHTLHAFAPNYAMLSKPFTAQAGQALDLGDVPFERMTAQPGTIGVTLRGDSETPPTAVFLIPGGPAETAGVHLGDQVAAVDGAAVTGVVDANARIKGAPGTPVQLTLRRGDQPVQLTIQRAP